MRLKKVLAIMLAAIVTASMSACGSDNAPENTGSTAETTTTAATTTASETTTTAAETTTVTDPAETDASDNNSNNSTESVKVYYGWGQDEDEYTAVIYCPEGAVFDEYTLESYAELIFSCKQQLLAS